MNIQRIGQAMFGQNWKAPLAKELGVNERTVRRWATGEFAVSKSASCEIIALAENCMAELAAILREESSMMNIHELIELRERAKAALMEAHGAFQVEQLCELYAAATMAVHWSGNEVMVEAALERLYNAGGQPEVVNYFAGENPVKC